MNSQRWALTVVVGTVAAMLVTVAAIVWNARYTRPVNFVEVTETRQQEDGIYADFVVENVTLRPPTVRSSVIRTDTGGTEYIYEEFVPNKVDLGQNTTDNFRAVNLSGEMLSRVDEPVALGPGCYKRVWTSELVYPTWFSSKSEFYSYETDEFCL